MIKRPFRLYNSFTRQVEEVDPISPGKVGMYACGPTVYNFAHIGNFRTNLFVDLLRRALRHFGFEVRHVMQMTDVDDKTIRGAREAGLGLKEFTSKYAQAFREDAAALNILPPDVEPNATDHIPEMIELIRQLLEKEAAYVSGDGSVYFRINSFPAYGCLCHLDREGLMAGARVSQDEYHKEQVGDFVLWKKWTEADGDVGWDSPWGRGRPGWHIECSAISMRFLGAEFDIHCGGIDLKFPHHENEIAQSEAATGKKFVHHWVHCEHLLVENQKMSKSLGNLHTVREILEKGYSGRELRYSLLAAHYRQNMNFTWKGMADAKLAVARIDEWRERFGSLPPVKTEGSFDPATHPFTQDFDAAMAEDMNVPDALGHLFQLIRETNKEMDAGRSVPYLGEIWSYADEVFGLGDRRLEISADVQALIDARAEARRTKDFKLSDELRGKIEALGWKVKDTAKGQEIRQA